MLSPGCVSSQERLDMGFKDPGLFRDPSLFYSLCTNLSPLSLAAHTGLAGLEANVALKRSRTSWEKRPSQMKCMRLPWKGILRSLGERQRTCSREWGFAEKSSLFYQKIPPVSAGEGGERVCHEITKLTKKIYQRRPPFFN